MIGRQVLSGAHTLQNDPPAGGVVKLAYLHHYNQLYAVPGAGDPTRRQQPESTVRERQRP